MSPSLKKVCCLLWDAFALFALVFTLSLLLGLHSALIVSAEFIIVFLFLVQRIVSWTTARPAAEHPGSGEIFRTAFWHCLRGFAVFILVFCFFILLVSNVL